MGVALTQRDSARAVSDFGNAAPAQIQTLGRCVAGFRITEPESVSPRLLQPRTRLWACHRTHSLVSLAVEGGMGSNGNVLGARVYISFLRIWRTRNQREYCLD